MIRGVANALIESTMLGFEDHGCMVLFLHLKYAGAGQGFGGYGLDEPIHDANGNFLHRQGHAFGMELIKRILETVGVDSWEKLPGKYVRADHEDSKVHRIGHIIEDRWLDVQELADQFSPKGGRQP